MPGAAPYAVAAVRNNATTSMGVNSRHVLEIAFFIFVALIGSLLALISALLVDMDFGHEPAEILGVVGQVVEIGGVKIKHLARRVTGGIQDHIERLAASQRDRVGVIVQIVSRLIPQQLGVVTDNVHPN